MVTVRVPEKGAYFTSFSIVSTVNFEQVNAGWEYAKKLDVALNYETVSSRHLPAQS